MSRPSRAPRRQHEITRLKSSVADLERLAEESGHDTPRLLQLANVPVPVHDEWFRFKNEVRDPTDRTQDYLKPPEGHTTLCQRTANNWALLDPATGKMVIPEFKSRNDPQDENVYVIVGYMTPMNDGSRRASRGISGHTPLYKTQSHENLWQMKTKVLKDEVLTPRAGHAFFFGNKIPCVIFPSANNTEVEYIAQTPDRHFRPYWRAATERWALAHARGEEQELPVWRDVDLTKPRPWYLNKWAMTVMRLEQGLPPTHPDDPERPAMLGLCRLKKRARDRRAPTTEAEWSAIPVEDCDPGDDTAGASDAGSINDDVERGLPTCHDWDPATKKSRSGRGNEPHPYPEVVAQELARNAAWDAQSAGGGATAQATPGALDPPSQAATPEDEPTASAHGALAPGVDTVWEDLGSDVDAHGEIDESVHPNPHIQPLADGAGSHLAHTAVQPAAAPPPPTAPSAAVDAPNPSTVASADATTSSGVAAPMEPARAGPSRPIYFVPPPGAPTVRGGQRRGRSVRERSRAFTEELD
ncbi:hypothetical protein FRC08_006891 [Ceratobasidium sp. 394]|nr:hypothetical protein FRC08_006891 [Ceratobasidium sp. 394]